MKYTYQVVGYPNRQSFQKDVAERAGSLWRMFSAKYIAGGWSVIWELAEEEEKKGMERS